MGVKWDSSCCDELWRCDYHYDNFVAYVDVAADTQIICFNGRNAENATRITACPEIVCQRQDAFADGNDETVSNAQDIANVGLSANVDSDSNFLCIVQGVVGVYSNA